MNDNIAGASPEPGPAPSPVVMFGIDPGGKAHASRFPSNDAGLAERAAGLMGMKVLRLESARQIEVGSQVNLGKIFSGGKALCPFIRRTIFDQLDADPAAFSPGRPAEAETPPAAASKAGGNRPTHKASEGKPGAEKAAPDPATPPADHDALTVGHLVLAAEENAPTIWYLAKVTALKGPELLQLTWSDPEWSAEPPIIRHRDHLALLPRAIAATLK